MNWQGSLTLVDLLVKPLQWSLQGGSLIKMNMNMYVTLFLNYTHKSMWAPPLQAWNPGAGIQIWAAATVPV